MDDRHVALLRRHRDTFVKSVEVELLLPLLDEIISPREIAEMKQLPSSQARVEKLLDILPAKGRPAFTYLCLALEKTYPHLLTVMCIGRDRELTGSSPSTVSPYTSESDIDESSPRMLMPRPNSAFIPRMIPGPGSKEHGISPIQSSLDSDNEEVSSVFKGVNMGPSDQSLPERGIADRGVPHRDYRKLQGKYHEAMLKMETLKRQNEETLKMCDQARKDADYYCKQHRTAMSNGDQLRGKLQGLQQEYAELMSERNQVQQEINDLRQRHEDDAKELSELRVQSREFVSVMGQPDVKRMYDMAMDRYETLKHEYDTLQKRFADLKSSHGSGVNKIERLQEDTSQLQLQLDTAIKERNALKQQCTGAIREYEKARRDQEELRKQEIKAQQENRLLKQAIKKTQIERDQAVREHRLVMSERDDVHKEIEKLQDEAQHESVKRRTAEDKLATMQNDYGHLHHKLVDTLREQDQSEKKISDLSERYLNNTMMAKKERDSILQELHKYKEELQVARHERKEALDQLEEVVQERYKAKQEQEMTNHEYKEVNKEVESLRRKVDSLTREHKEAAQESDNAKRLRDYAYMERDKIVAERESIRALCDKLRRERDRAVSNYAEALRKTDDVERKKNEVTKELNEVKQNVIQQEEKEARMRQLIAHRSRDSAIDADSQEWQMEMVEIETVKDDGDMTMLGFDIGDCNKDHQFPDDCSVVITKVDKGSVADGRLKVNDCVVRVNNVDLTNGGDCSIAVQAVKNSRGVLNMVVKRRRPSGIRHHPVKLFYGGKDHGLVLDNGIFISRIVPGSAAAKEGSLLPGDRILDVDGYPVENKSVNEVEEMLSTSNESVMLNIVRATGMSISSSTSPTGESIQSHETSSSKSSLTPYLPPMEIPEQKSDRNGNPQQPPSAKDETVQQALRAFVQRRESMHSRESSHESANSGEKTPLALSRQNSVKEQMHNADAKRDKRMTVGDYPQNSLKRGELGGRDSRRSYSGHESMPVEYHTHPVHANGQYDQMRHGVGEYLRPPSPNTAPHHENYGHDNGRDAGRVPFNGGTRGNENGHRSQDGGRRDVAHLVEINKEVQPLTNGEHRPHPGSRESSGKENAFIREGNRESLNGDFPPVQFDRTNPHRESIHNRHGTKSVNRKREFNSWNEPNRFTYPSRVPNQKPSFESSQSHWEECNNGRVHNNHVNGNVQVSRPVSQDCGPRDFHASSPHMQQHVHPSHTRSWSSSSGRDMEPNFNPEEYVSFTMNNGRDHDYADWDQKDRAPSDIVFTGIAESKTVPVKKPAQQVHVKDHSTWPRSHAPPDSYKQGRKKRRRGPIPDMTPRNDNTEAIVKPTPPSRTSSFKASLRHVEPSSPSNLNGSESRRQPSTAGSEVKSQGSLHKSQSPTVKVSPINPVSPFNNNVRHKTLDSPKQNGFFRFDAHPDKKPYVSETKEITQAVAFRPVSVPSISQVKYLPSEGAIVPRVEPIVQTAAPGPYTSKRPEEPLQIVRADPVMTVPPWDTSSLPSDSGSRYNTWTHFSMPAKAEVIIQPVTVPSYKATSYKLQSAITNNLYYPDSPSTQPPSPGLPDFDPFPMYPREPIALSRTSLPGSGRSHQTSNLSTSSEYSTASLPIKFHRIHIPSYPSRPSPGPSSSSDIASINSGHSSPTSPSLIDDSPYLSPAVSVEPSVTVISQGGPHDTRLIEIEKTLEPGLGFSIKESGGIFVNTVTEGSLADRGGLKYGDQILEVNGINLRRATYDNAVQILTRAGNSICIKVQYNRNKMGDDQRDSMCSSTQSTPIASQTSTRTNSPTPTITPPTPRASRTQSILSSTSSVMLSEQPRFVFLTKSGGSLGIRMYGGNKVGIFVSEIEPMSPAAKPDGLRVGDQILEYNGVDLRTATAERASIELQKPADKISILVQHNLSKFNKIQNHHCDELYIKALVDFSAEKEGQISFKREDILVVEDTMYNGSLGVWIAWLVSQDGKKCRGGGQIPSKNALHREMVRRRLLSEGMQEEELRTASSRRSSGPARRSFLKRKKKHQHNNSKDSRELSEGSMTDVPVHEDASVPTYLRVEPLDMHIKRPVILLGPLVEKVAQKMAEESPNKYVKVYPKMVQSTGHLIEKDIENGLILDSHRKDGMFEVINTSDVKEICKKGCHCILNGLNPHIAERLQRLQLHPIVIFVKFKTIKHIKEQKDPHFLRERVTHKQAKELFEAANKIEQEFKSLFSDIIQGGNLASVSTRVKNLIDSEQRKPIWIPSSQPL